MLSEDKLWLPPLSPRDQKRLASFRRKKWKWLGFSDKTLWNWLQLLGVLAIPIVLVLGTLWFGALQSQMSEALIKNQHDTALAISQQQRDTEQAIAEDQQREATLNTYFDRMSELLLDKNLNDPKAGAGLRVLARARTLIALRSLDPFRKGVLVQFLNESGLIKNDNTEIDLTGADLSNANRSGANLFGADLSNATLTHAFLFEATLTDTNLSNATLVDANLSDAMLIATDLTGANLSGAILDEANLSHAFLNGAFLIFTSLHDTMLTDTRLIKAVLPFANLSSAILTHADLSNTDLFGADLSSAMLNDANLNGAILTDTNLTGANLTDALLRGAHILNEQLTDVRSLKGAICPAGQHIHNRIGLAKTQLQQLLTETAINLVCLYGFLARKKAAKRVFSVLPP